MLWVMLLWVMALAATWWWLCSQAPPEPDVAAPAADPYAAEVEAFRRQVHDWDRNG